VHEGQRTPERARDQRKRPRIRRGVGVEIDSGEHPAAGPSLPDLPACGRRNRQYWNRRLPQHALGRRSKERLADAAQTPGADHDEIGAEAAGRTGDDSSRFADQRVRGDSGRVARAHRLSDE
jgi:hypothetical protein